MPKKPKLTDDEVKKLMLDNPLMGERAFCKKFQVGAHRWARLRRSIEPELAAKKMEADPEGTPPKNQWIYDKYYTYNSDTDTYVTFLRSSPKPIIMPGDIHRAMQKAYSNWDGNPSTINEICRTFSFPRPWFMEYKQRHGWTHDKEPFTTEEVLTREIGGMVEEALEQRRNVLFQRYEQEKWKETKGDADKWRQLLQGSIRPFNIAIEEWRPVKPMALPKVKDDAEKFSLVVATTDWQIGLKAIQDNQTIGKDWNVEVGIRVIHNYLSQIEQDVRRFRVNWGTCYLLNGGDLPHGLRGFTEAGTPLIMDVTKKQQYDAVFSLQTFFIEGLHRIFGDLEELGVQGNHDGYDWYAIARALQERYRNSPGIRISASTKMVVYKKIGRTLFILTHGKNPFGYKFKYAVNDGDKRKSQIQAEIIRVWREIAVEDPGILKDVVQTIFIQGDNHHFHHVEHGVYEDMQFGTASLGDMYAEATRLAARPSQNCILVSHTHGVKGPLRYYFDTMKG